MNLFLLLVIYIEEYASLEKFTSDLRSEVGEELILEKNIFVERIMPSSIIRNLSEEGKILSTNIFFSKINSSPTSLLKSLVNFSNEAYSSIYITNSRNKFIHIIVTKFP
jgi:hypothetical protein